MFKSRHKLHKTVSEPQTPQRDYFSDSQRTYSCIHCRAHLANHNDLISKLFQGNHGRAFLFNRVVNVGTKQAVQRELLTGLHAVADIYCDNCETTLGWKYEHAFVASQKYKEGKYIIELAHMLKENNWEPNSYNSQDLLHSAARFDSSRTAREGSTWFMIGQHYFGSRSYYKLAPHQRDPHRVTSESARLDGVVVVATAGQDATTTATAAAVEKQHCDIPTAEAHKTASCDEQQSQKRIAFNDPQIDTMAYEILMLALESPPSTDLVARVELNRLESTQCVAATDTDFDTSITVKNDQTDKSLPSSSSSSSSAAAAENSTISTTSSSSSSSDNIPCNETISDQQSPCETMGLNNNNNSNSNTNSNTNSNNNNNSSSSNNNNNTSSSSNNNNNNNNNNKSDRTNDKNNHDDDIAARALFTINHLSGNYARNISSQLFAGKPERQLDGVQQGSESTGGT